MPIRGISMLPPTVSNTEAIKLYRKSSKINRKLGRLNALLSKSIINSSIFEILSFQESVQSTRIEGTQVTFTDLIDEAAKEKKSSEVQEVLNYKKALSLGVDLIRAGNPITSNLIKKIHSTLMDGEARGTISSKGQFRKIQNYIGPEGCNETNASYIPVNAGEIGNYMTNLEYFINNEHHSSFVFVEDEDRHTFQEDDDPIIKTAIMHAQFESIHPFLDGNGRTGRILIVLNILKDSLIDQPVFFVSEELEKERIRYYNALNGVRGSSPDWFSWIEFFLNACDRMASGLLEKLEGIDKLAYMGMDLIREKEGSKGRLIDTWLHCIGEPFCTVKDTASRMKISDGTARKYLNQLVNLKLIDVDKTKSRNLTYVNYELLRVIS